MVSILSKMMFLLESQREVESLVQWVLRTPSCKVMVSELVKIITVTKYSNCKVHIAERLTITGKP